MHQWFKISTQL